MKVAAKNLAEATIEIMESEDEKTAAAGLFNWLKRKNKIRMLPEIFSEIDRQLEVRGEVVAKVVSARPLSDDENLKIIEKIKTFGRYHKVEIKNIIDPKIIGGLQITFADRLILGTIRERLNNLKRELLKI
jgi:ATP synthase F1 delta subunit